MEPGKDQPRQDVKRNVAQLAKSNLLLPFSDLNIIGAYASAFGLDPDYVYDNTGFGTIANFHVMWKEQQEYSERYSHIWDEVNRPPTK